MNRFVLGLTFFALSNASLDAQPRSKPEKILLDTDIGTDVDDALALVLAARSPEVELVSITTVGGHTEVRARLARKLLALAGKGKAPVTAGLASPLPTDRFAVWFPHGLWMGHEGKAVLSDEEMAEPPDVAGDQAPKRIVATLMESAEKLTMVTIGPTTNFAAALRLEPRIVSKIKRYVAMGGNVMGPPMLNGRELPSILEYNFNSDREAAATVLSSGLPITLVPIELTIQARMTAEESEALGKGDAAAQALAKLVDIWAPIQRGVLGSFNNGAEQKTNLACLLHDPLALLALIRPQLLTFQDVRISVKAVKDVLETKADPSGEIPIRVATAADFRAVNDFILTRLRGPAAGQPRKKRHND